jgi:hypothetical protein
MNVDGNHTSEAGYDIWKFGAVNGISDLNTCISVAFADL